MAAAQPAIDLAALADRCVRCGLCLPHCPTYRLGREEGESPRGRIALAAALARAPARAADPGLARHLGSCLACGACEQVCPAEVRFDALLVEARRRIAESRPHARGLRLLLALLARPRAWQLALALLRALDRTPLDGLAIRLGLRPPADALPSPPPRWRPAARGEGRPVYLFGGCVGERFDRDALAAAERLLRRLGFRALAARRPACCGNAHAHLGAAAAADRLASRLPSAYPGSAPVLVLHSGCLATVRATLGGRARGIHEFLLEAGASERLRFRPARATVVLHRPCTLRGDRDESSALARLLTAVPEATVATLPERGRCCGAAGLHFLARPEAARAHREELLAEIAARRPAAVLSANTGCRMWIEAALRLRHPAVPVHHSLDWLARHLAA